MVFSVLRTIALCFVIALLTTTSANAETDEIIYDIVIENGRAMDPETGLDGVRNIGIAGGTIGAISEMPLRGKAVIDAKDHVVVPGFIDIHTHTARLRSVFFIKRVMVLRPR